MSQAERVEQASDHLERYFRALNEAARGGSIRAVEDLVADSCSACNSAILDLKEARDQGIRASDNRYKSWVVESTAKPRGAEVALFSSNRFARVDLIDASGQIVGSVSAETQSYSWSVITGDSPLIADGQVL
jgi:hypothetical protein